MTKPEPIKPLSRADQIMKEAMEKRLNSLLADVECPEHHQRPKVVIVDPAKLSFRVEDLCCERLGEEVHRILSSADSD